METKFKDVAHLYLGCEIEDDEKPHGTTAILDSVDTNGDCYYNYYNNETYQSDTDSVMCHVDDIKPILKDLSDITEEDCKAIGFEDESEWYHFLWEYPTPQFNAEGFMYLLSKGYDLFNLLSTNQAINAKKD